MRGAGIRLETLHGKRKKADYAVGQRVNELKYPIDKTESEKAIASAKNVIDRIEAVRPKDKAIGISRPKSL